MNLPDLLKMTLDMRGSDLHLSTGSSPQVRVDGHLRVLDQVPMLTPDVTKALAYSVLTDAQKKTFEETWELDLAFGLRGVGRFRCNVFNQKGAVAAVFRMIHE
ncbi:MAG: twitching motility protein PilT, partial [Pirellulales bacterium]